MTTATCCTCGATFKYQPRRSALRRECSGCNAERRIDGSRPVVKTRIQGPASERRVIHGIIERWGMQWS